jgi:hypothetical protein
MAARKRSSRCRSTRKHTPIVSEAERRYFYAERARKKRGERGETDMSIDEIDRHLTEVRHKKLRGRVSKPKTRRRRRAA